jgi:hypothetical protein
VELNIHLEDSVSTKTEPREIPKSNIHGRAAIAKPLITESNVPMRKRRCRDCKSVNTVYVVLTQFHDTVRTQCVYIGHIYPLSSSEKSVNPAFFNLPLAHEYQNYFQI